MDRSLCFRRAVAVLLCCLLVFRSTLPVAHAAEPVTASLTIAAGAMALGGLSAAAVENTIGPQIAAIIGTTMQGLGTSVYTAEDSALTKTKFIMSKIAVWCVQAKMAKEDFYRRVAEGVTVAANGTIQLSHDASKLISQFISWVFTQGTDTVVPEISSSGTTVTFDDISFPVSPLTVNMKRVQDGMLYDYSLTVNNPSSSVALAFCLQGSSGGYAVVYPCFIIAPGQGKSVSYTSVYKGVTQTKTETLYNRNGHINAYYGSFGIGYVALQGLPANCHVFNSESEFYSFASSITGTWNPSEALPGQDVFVGQESTWDENKDLLNPAIDNVTTITPDLINKLIEQLADGQTATMDIATYLDSLVDAFDGLKSQVAEITDTLTGIQESLAVPDSLTSTVTNESEDPDSDPRYEPEKVDPPGVVENLRYPLKDYFPFCIPFDLYALFQIFNADPVAPAFTIDYTFPVGNGIPIHINVDLSDWDSLASTVRFLEVVSFIVGLAVATRRLFIRV